jgi:hypothetical protein
VKAEAYIAAHGLVLLEWPAEAAGTTVGYSKGFLEVLRLLQFRRQLHKAQVYTTPDAVQLMHALAHAGKMWPLHSYYNIVGLIGRAGLRTYHAAWTLDAPETDLSELLNTLAADHRARVERRR